jgi:site-specific recombinase XerD
MTDTYKEINMRLSKNRISCYKRKLHEFLDYCNAENIKSIEKVDLATILHFIYKAGLQKRNDMFKLTSSLRVFFNYLYEQDILKFDFSAKVPRYKRIAQSKIPSTYTKEEIEKLLSSINRSNSLGEKKLCYYSYHSQAGNQGIGCL